MNFSYNKTMQPLYTQKKSLNKAKLQKNLMSRARLRVNKKNRINIGYIEPTLGRMTGRISTVVGVWNAKYKPDFGSSEWLLINPNATINRNKENVVKCMFE